MSINTARHKEIINPNSHPVPIHIIGAGATGSRLFAALIELGFTDITVYDYDHVESHNIANQLFDYDDIGKLKIDGLKKWAQNKLGEDHKALQFVNCKLPDPSVHLDGIVFLLVDTMAARKEIFEECIKDNPTIVKVFETRMASSYGNIISFVPETQSEQWLSSLISDDDAEVSACGSSISVGTTASILANQCVWQFMLSLTDPVAADDIVDIFLKPFCMSTRSWDK